MTRRPVTLLFLAVSLVVHGCASAPPRATPARRSPLVVVLVVDQMRGGYLESYGASFTGGLKRLMDEGAWFRRAAYPYLNTVTCAGHSTIGTGALPYRHGMVLNAWWDRDTARSRPCTSDPAAKNIGYMGTPTGGESAASLLVPPLAQQLREKTGGRSVALSLKPRSAITMAGRNPNAVLWFDERAGWTTSSAFTDKPIAWLQTYVDAHPVEADRGKVWDRLMPETAYQGDDNGAGERTPSGWTQVFPHALGTPPAQFLIQWQRSPFADAYLGQMAAHAIDTLDLGRGTGTDFLSVSFSTLDLVGHQYGPASHEVQDVLLRLDRTIGTLLDHLDARLGRDGYVLALSSDHGVAPIPEQSGGGRQPSADVTRTIDTTLAPFFGPGKYVIQTVYTDIYLAPGVFDRLKASEEASAAVLDALRSLPGIAQAFRVDQVSAPSVRTSADPVKRAAALSYYAPRSGDLIVVPKENWLLSTAATTHGTLYTYDQRVPVVFFGAGVRPGVHDGPATPADIAPTLAALARAPFDATDGVVLLR
ncbi:MAG TPA: alkaline phosphatase family protein [Vicinamibacterales bacterium]|nr:alkaline phosphatase family protein [Vicinamibacterales bacterium]